MVLSLLIFQFFAAVPSGTQQDWEDVRSIAESQHEIIMLLIDNEKFSEVLEETNKIFSLRFPVEHQGLLVEGAEEISDALIHHKQHELAQRVLDQCLSAISDTGLQSRVCKLKAYLFKKMGNDEEAMNFFRRAIDLERAGDQP